ncbi:MAG: methyltransferase domain-containing protein [Bacteroidota bacterium]
MDQLLTPQPVKNIDELPRALHYIADQLSQKRNLKPAEMRTIVLDAGVQLQDIEAWADFDHPIEDSYGRKLVFKGDHFEIMVMSWCPGDFSSIHDHGHTQWGCVQVFGPAEHATFRYNEDQITTLARWTMHSGEAIGVHHNLVHQMGNSSDQNFLSLHVYGLAENINNVTDDARVFDLEKKEIHRIDGGVFFALPSNEINLIEEGPEPDFPTRLRYMTELVKRLKKMEDNGIQSPNRTLKESKEQFVDANSINKLIEDLKNTIDEAGHHTNSIFWRILNWELKEAAILQKELTSEDDTADSFHKYAEMYDSIICQPCMDNFMKGYLKFFVKEKNINLSEKDIISVGCGTGKVEAFMIEELGANRQKLFGMDISPAMVNEAKRRINADVGDVLTLDPDVKLWDIAYSGLNVFHYINHKLLKESIEKTAAIVKRGGYFIGDFITPDHIRWYPNVLISNDQKTISLRTPELIEENGSVFQRSEIINITNQEGEMVINYAGKHKRFLPPMVRMRYYFKKAFGGSVELYDAHSLEVVPEWADSCQSTRYIIIAQKS